MSNNPLKNLFRSRVHDVESSSNASEMSPSRYGGNDRSKAYEFRKYDDLDRSLHLKHITSIAFSGTVGIGIFITSGELIGIAGPLGCVLSFIVAGIIVIGVMRSLAELVSVNPCAGALMQYPDDYVDKALGFAVGVTYWLAQCVSMAVLTAAAARVTNNFEPENPLNTARRAGIILGFCVATLTSNALGVRIYGNLERFVKWIKLLTIISLCVLMILVNLKVGVHCSDPTGTGSATTAQAPETELVSCHKSTVVNYNENPLPPFFNFFGFNETMGGTDSALGQGIPGAGGRFLAVWTCTTLAVFACMGGDIVIVTAGEAKYPRRDLPAAARFMYLVPLSFYVLMAFLVGLNVDYGEQNLFRPYINVAKALFPSPSPFIIALNHTVWNKDTLRKVYSALFMFSAYTAANTALFSSSRTLFSFSQMHGPKWMAQTFGRTSNGRTPHAAILLCSCASLLALVGLADGSFNQPILNLSSFFTGATGCVYASECIAYIRYYKGFRHLENSFGPSRNSSEYVRKYYRPHWQPLWAWIGLIGCTLIVLFTGWPAIYIMAARNHLRATVTQGEQVLSLKSNHRLAWDVVASYSGVVIFFALFFVRKYWPGNTTTIKKFKEYQGRYQFPEFDDIADLQSNRSRLHVLWKMIK